MTLEKAISWLKYAVPIKVVTVDEMSDFRIAKDMAFKALQKNIPKEPIWEGDGYADGEMVYDRWYCPRCDMDYDAEYEKHDYCPVCGQKILREEESE